MSLDGEFVHQLSDGRFFITDMTVIETPELARVLGHMSNYWTRHECLDGWVSPAPEPQ